MLYVRWVFESLSGTGDTGPNPTLSKIEGQAGWTIRQQRTSYSWKVSVGDGNHLPTGDSTAY